MFRLLWKSIAFPSSHKIIFLWFSIVLSLQLANVVSAFYQQIIITRSLLKSVKANIRVQTTILVLMTRTVGHVSRSLYNPV